MRCCQVCGCTSWGPVGNPDELRRASAFLPDARVEEFVRCDGCKTVAKQEFLQQESPQVRDLTSGRFPGVPLDLPALMKEVIAPIPPPPTRTERLVVKLLDSFLIDSDTSPRDIVKLARDIETALDVLERKDSQQPWLMLTFARREEFELWCTGFWEGINAAEDFTTTRDYPRAWYEAAVAYIEQKYRLGV